MIVGIGYHPFCKLGKLCYHISNCLSAMSMKTISQISVANAILSHRIVIDGCLDMLTDRILSKITAKIRNTKR